MTENQSAPMISNNDDIDIEKSEEHVDKLAVI
jgi:hypothetical protein